MSTRMLLRVTLFAAVVATMCLAQSCSDLTISCSGVANKDGTKSNFCTLVRKDKKVDGFDDGVCECAPGGEYSSAWFDDDSQWKNFGAGVESGIGSECAQSCDTLYNKNDCEDGQFKNYLLQGETPKDKKFYALKLGVRNSIDPTFNSFASLKDGSSCPGNSKLSSGSLDFLRSDKCGSVNGYNGLQTNEDDGYYRKNPYAYGGYYSFVNSRSTCPQLRKSWDDWQGIVCREKPTTSTPAPKTPTTPTVGCKKNSDCTAQGPCGTATCKKGTCVYEFLAANTPCTSNGKLSGACDANDVCDGKSAQCVDAVAPSTQKCRDAAGDCDVAEFCTGLTKECPKDKLASKDVVCRAASKSNACDAAEYCTGASSACPPDATIPGCKPQPPPAVPPTPKTTKFDGCVKCTSVTVGTSTQVVTVSLESCKSGSSISWFCCRNTNNYGANVCKLQSCTSGTADGVTCSDSTSAKYTLPKTEKTLVLQVADTQLTGSVDCKDKPRADGLSDCCGSSKSVGVALFTLDLSTCGVSAPNPAPKPPATTCSNKCSDRCATCKIRPENDPTKVIVDFSGCNGGSAMDWACCLDKGCDADSCSGGNSRGCDHDNKRSRCDNVKQITFSVAKDATSVSVQYSDGQMLGDVSCGSKGTSCCGSSSSSCSASSSVCTQEISLEDCAECAADSDCMQSDDECERRVCVKGTCTSQAVNAGTVCRKASGECEYDAVCDGKTSKCPNNELKTKKDVCRASTGDCDEPEMCDGKCAECPVDTGKKKGCTVNAVKKDVEVQVKRR